MIGSESASAAFPGFDAQLGDVPNRSDAKFDKMRS